MGWVVNDTLAPFTPGNKPGTHCTGGWLGPNNGLDVCTKSCQRDLIPRPYSPQHGAIPTTLFHPPKNGYDLHTQGKWSSPSHSEWISPRNIFNGKGS